MIRLHVVVEGQTEEAFVNRLLAPALAERGVFADACLIGVPGHKGGNVRWERLRKDLLHLLLGDRSSYATTMFDWFRRGPDFPGGDLSSMRETVQKRRALEDAMMEGLREACPEVMHRFIPYVQMHEFEGLLFADTEAFARGVFNHDLASGFRTIREEFSNPEEINDGPDTAPSKRISKLFRDHGFKYQKVVFGELAAAEIGLPTIRRECPNFHEWVCRLESLNTA